MSTVEPALRSLADALEARWNGAHTSNFEPAMRSLADALEASGTRT